MMGPKVRTRKGSRSPTPPPDRSARRTTTAKKRKQPSTAPSPAKSSSEVVLPGIEEEAGEPIYNIPPECPDFCQRWYCKNGSLCNLQHDYSRATLARLSCQIDSVTADLSLLHKKVNCLQKMVAHLDDSV